jgi:hypothetical protein
VLGRFPI